MPLTCIFYFIFNFTLLDYCFSCCINSTPFSLMVYFFWQVVVMLGHTGVGHLQEKCLNPCTLQSRHSKSPGLSDPLMIDFYLWEKSSSDPLEVYIFQSPKVRQEHMTRTHYCTRVVIHLTSWLTVNHG